MINANSPFLAAILPKEATNQLIAGLADSSTTPGPQVNTLICLIKLGTL